MYPAQADAQNAQASSNGLLQHLSLCAGYATPKAVSLPTEILEDIFRLVFDLNRVEKDPNHIPDSEFHSGFVLPPPLDEQGQPIVNREDDDDPCSTMWPMLGDMEMEHGSLFPYCISRVCSRWNEICLRIPEFWTRIFIDVGSGATSVTQLQRELVASKGRPLDVVHISRRDRFEAQDEPEHRRADAFARLLAQHLDRCVSLRVNTVHRRSLYHIRKHLVGNAPKLKVLYMNTVHHDFDEIQDQGSAGGNLILPRVKGMEVDVSILRHHMSNEWLAPSPIDTPRPFQSLTVVDVACSMEEHRLILPIVEMFEALDKIPTLTHLVLVGVRFDPDYLSDGSYSWVVGHHLRRLKCLHLEDLQPRAVRTVIEGINPHRLQTLSIRNCPLADFALGSWRSGRLACSLELADQDPDEDLGPFLLGMDAIVMKIYNCPSFNTMLVEQMCEEGFPYEPADSISPSLTRLDISGDSLSELITVQSLKNLVVARREARERFQALLAAEQQDVFLRRVHYSIINVLILEGFGEMDQADLEWFEENVEEFEVV